MLFGCLCLCVHSLGISAKAKCAHMQTCFALLQSQLSSSGQPHRLPAISHHLPSQVSGKPSEGEQQQQPPHRSNLPPGAQWNLSPPSSQCQPDAHSLLCHEHLSGFAHTSQQQQQQLHNQPVASASLTQAQPAVTDLTRGEQLRPAMLPSAQTQPREVQTVEQQPLALSVLSHEQIPLGLSATSTALSPTRMQTSRLQGPNTLPVSPVALEAAQHKMQHTGATASRSASPVHHSLAAHSSFVVYQCCIPCNRLFYCLESMHTHHAVNSSEYKPHRSLSLIANAAIPR